MDMKAAWNKGITVIQGLKQACMLEEVGETLVFSKHYKMHDILRGMALWIASDLGAHKNKWIVQPIDRFKEAVDDITNKGEVEVVSLANTARGFEDDEFVMPQLSNYPNLSFLSVAFWGNLRSDGCFYNMSSLTYLLLDIFTERPWELPKSIGCLTGLRFLGVKCPGLASVPMELSSLKELKYLSLESPRSIPYGLISQLKKLEILEIRGYEGWGKEGEASLEELGSSKFGLKALGIQVYILSDLKQVSGNPRVSLWRLYLVGFIGVTTLPLSETILQNGDNIHSLQLIKLLICEDLEEIVLTGRPEEEFENLQSLEFSYCEELQKITWAGGVRPRVLFRNVTSLHIDGCTRLKSLTWIGQLCYLERFWLESCQEMEQVIGDDDDDDGNESVGSAAAAEIREEGKITNFSHLKVLVLADLPRLHIFSNYPVDFRSLEYLQILECPVLDESSFSGHQIVRGYD